METPVLDAPSTFLRRLPLLAGRVWRRVRVGTRWHLRRRETQVLLGAFALAVCAHLAIIFFPPLEANDDDSGETVELVETAELTLSSFLPIPTDTGNNPLNVPATLTELNLPSALPHNFDDAIQREPERPRLNGFNDIADGGTVAKPAEIRSGGGGGSGANVAELGHVRSDDMGFGRLHWKPDPGAKLKVEGSAAGTATSIPGTATQAGAGEGLGNGSGSGALASSGSGGGSGVGLNGSNSGTGLGKAPPLPVTRDPVVLYRDSGTYPYSARASGHTGAVLLDLDLLEDGSIARVDVHTSSGYSELDEAAIAALKNWHFAGALKDGRPVKFQYQVPFSFTLTRN